MSLWEAFLLALVEGLTEFLPISSTGHMVAVSTLLKLQPTPFLKTYIIAIQLSAIAAIPILYWKRLRQKKLYVYVGLAFIPTALVGLALADWVEIWLEKPIIVGISWISGGFIFLFLDKLFAHNNAQWEDISWKKALMIGFIQALSIIPGVSRSAAAMVGGYIQGLNRENAAEFSFLLAVPTIGAAALYKLYKTPPSSAEWHLLSLGSLVSWGVALLTVPLLVKLLVRYGFRPFGWYRIAVGIGILLYAGL